MGERRKRQRLSEDGSAAITIAVDEEPNSSSVALAKSHLKETNASAKRSLFVRSLPSTVTSNALTELFSESYPLKHATVVLDPITKQSKGYGFVTFADADDAQRAKEDFHGHSFQGRKIKVEVAEPRHRDIVGKVVDGGKRKSTLSTAAVQVKKAREECMAEARKPPKLIIRNLPWSIKEPEQLAVLFRPFGKVKYITLPKRQETQAGFGFIVMRGKKNAENALSKLDGQLVDGRTLAVDWAVEKEVWEGQKETTGDEDENTSIAGKDSEDVGMNKSAILKPSEEESKHENDDVANFLKNHFSDLEDEEVDEDEVDGNDPNDDDILEDDDDELGESEESDEDESSRDDEANIRPTKIMITDNSTTLFVRNLPFTARDPELKEHFMQFGAVRYARVVMDRATDRPKGTGFVCFFNLEDAENCLREAPRFQPTGANATKSETVAPSVKRSLLQDENADAAGMYTIDGRVLQVSKAVEKSQAVKLTAEGTSFRDNRDKDKRRLYLLSEGTVASGTPLYEMLSPSEVKMREDSAMQRKKLIQNNPSLHLSLSRLSIRNLPKNVTSKDLKALAREAVVGFATDVKSGTRAQLSKEEEARGGDEMREAEKQRKTKRKGIVKQSKIVFESREGAKVSEESGAGRSRGYGFIEYSSHRWALMGLRWLNGHAVDNGAGKKQRLIVEFAIENAQVVSRRKELEEKARIRSQQVLEARAKGELPEKEKKMLPKATLMKKTRKGMKPGDKGRFGNNTEMAAQRKQLKPQEKVRINESAGDRQHGTKRKRDAAEGGDKSKFKPGFPPGEEGRLARRQQIINKKRAMRSARKKGRKA